MLNQSIIVGRIVSKPEVEALEDGKKVLNMTLAVPRSYKNKDGEYETDFLDCTAWGGIAENTAEFCNKGDLIGIKGRIQTNLYEKDGQTHKGVQIVAEKVTFLSSNRKVDQEEEIDNSIKVKNKKQKDKEIK